MKYNCRSLILAANQGEEIIILIKIGKQNLMEQEIDR
jgi:hypothetical protein